jgi:hypothetical protein
MIQICVYNEETWKEISQEKQKKKIRGYPNTENTKYSGMKEKFDSADLLTSSLGFIRRQILRCQQTQHPVLVIQHFLDVPHFRARGLRRAVEVPHLHL